MRPYDWDEKRPYNGTRTDYVQNRKMSMKQAGEASSMSAVIDEVKNFCRECWEQMRSRHMKVYRVCTCGVSSNPCFKLMRNFKKLERVTVGQTEQRKMYR